MTYQHQGFESPSEALAKQSICAQDYDTSGQHTASCLFDKSGCEVWQNKYLKLVLLQWYISKNGRYFFPTPSTWDCPLPSCNDHFNTFRDVIIHLGNCKYLKPTTRKYTCPGCRVNVEMPAHTYPGYQTGVQEHAAGHGNKALLKIRRSLESIRDHLSTRSRTPSATSSPTASFSSDASPSQAGDQASSILYAAENTNFNAQQHNLFLNTQFLPAPPYGLWSNESGLSSTTTNSSCGFPSTFSAAGPSSAASFSPIGWTPTKATSSELSELPWLDGPNVSPRANSTQPLSEDQHLHGLLAELPERAFSQNFTNIQLDGMNVEEMLPYLPLGSNTNISCDDVGTFLREQEQRVHQESHLFIAELPVGLSQELYDDLEMTVDGESAADLFSPTSTNFSMADTLVPSEGNLSPTTIDSPGSLKCSECPWAPEIKGTRSLIKLKQAVEKHFKRNHRSKDYHCPVCNQPFKNRQDNVKPHVARKHPERLEEFFPPKGTAQDGPQYDKAIKAPVNPVIRRSGRGVRSQRV